MTEFEFEQEILAKADHLESLGTSWSKEAALSLRYAVMSRRRAAAATPPLPAPPAESPLEERIAALQLQVNDLTERVDKLSSWKDVIVRRVEKLGVWQHFMLEVGKRYKEVVEK